MGIITTEPEVLMEMRDRKKEFLLLQMNDSLFPIGGYSHSYGLETYIQKGIVCDLESAGTYIRNRLKTSFLYTDLLSVRLAWESTADGNLEELEDLEEQLDASRIPAEIREASRKLGSRFAKTLLHMNPAYGKGFFGCYLSRRKGKSISHSCAYGVFCACAGISAGDAMAGYLYAQTSAMVTNCVKTIPLSQSDGQELLYHLYPFLEQVLKEAADCGREMLGASACGFDLRSIQHEHLYSRLYMS